MGTKTEIYKQQFTISQILRTAWHHFENNFGTIALVILIVYVPVNLILNLAPVGSVNDDLSWDSIRGYIRLANVLETLIGIVATMAVAYIVKGSVDGKKVTLKSALKQALSKWHIVLLTSIMFSIYMIGLTLLLIVPAIIYSCYWAFWLYPVLFENKKWNAALDYSKAIVKGRWFKTATYFFVFGLVSAVLAFGVGFVTSLIWGVLGLADGTAAGLVFDVVSDVIIDVVFAYFLVVATVFYLNFNACRPVEVADSSKK